MISSGYTPFSNGGVEVISQVLAEALCEQGIEVTVLFFHDTEKDYCVGNVNVRVCRPKELKCKSKKIAYKVNRVLQMYNPFNRFIISKILEEEKPDIVHVQMLRKASYFMYNMCHKKKIPVITTLHEVFSLWNFDPFDEFKNMLISTPGFLCEKVRDMQRRSSNFVDYIIAPCQWIIDEYKSEKYYVDCDSKVIKNALPIDFTVADNLRKEKQQQIKEREKIKYLYIGRLDVFKGIELILDTLEEIRYENVEVHFAGEGPLKNLIEKKAIIDKRIIVHGYVEGEEKRRLFCDSDVLLFLSDNIETFGLVCLEALYYSLPIIATDIRATRQFVSNGYNGFIIEEKSKLQLKKRMETYIDKAILEFQVSNCINQLKKFDFNVFVKDTIRLYEDILTKRN